MTSGNPQHGRPSAAKLVATVARFLETTIGPAVSGNRDAQAKVTAAANALRRAERELLADSADDVTQTLAGLGFAEEEAQLATAIRNGTVGAAAAGHPQSDTQGQVVITAEQLPDRLRAVLGAALGLDIADVTIDNLRPLTRTYNRTTWIFDAVIPYGRRTLILALHTERPSRIRASAWLQAGVQVAAVARGVPVARIVAVDDSADTLGYPFLISEMVNGVTDYVHIAGQLDSADQQAGRTRLLRQCALALAAIHRMAPVPDGARQDRLEMYRQELDALDEASATFEWVFRWLAAHRPPPSRAVVVHGDYCMGNLLVDGFDLTAVIDWELVHVGEAYEDLAWFCIRAWRHGAPASLGAAGLGSIESFLSAYEKASGTSVDRVGFHWWLVMATLFRGVTLREMSQGWLREKVTSPSLAIAGRRACETEWDLLNLLDGTQPGDDAGRGRPEEKPGNRAQPGDDAGRGRPEEKPGNRAQPGDDAGRGRPEEKPGNRAQPGDDAGRGRPEEKPGNRAQPGDDAGRAAGGGTAARLRGTGQSDPAVTAAVYGRPSAAELVAGVADFLETMIGPAASGRNAQAEVTAAAEVLRVVERELLDDLADDAKPARQEGASMTSGDPRRGHPSAAKQVAAVAEFLETMIGPAASRQRGTHTQAEVTAAADALRTVERELLVGSPDDVTQALAALGFAEEAQLAAAIRNGDLDHRADDVTCCLRALANHRLAVTHPGYRNE